MEYIIGKTKKETILIDEEDLELVKQHTWSRIDINGKVYIRASITGKTLYLHRLLFGDIEKDLVVDHIDGNTLNNQRSNLRICTKGENRKNSSGKGKSKYKGLTRVNGGWQARITINGKPDNIGWYKDEIEAAEAYNNKVIELQDPYFRLNVIDGYSEITIEERKPRSKSNYFGVTWHNQVNKWWVRVRVSGKNHYLGLFEDEKEAAKVYNDFVIKEGLNKPLNEI